MDKLGSHELRLTARGLLTAAGALAISAVVGGALYMINSRKRSEPDLGGWADLPLDSETDITKGLSDQVVA